MAMAPPFLDNTPVVRTKTNGTIQEVVNGEEEDDEQS